MHSKNSKRRFRMRSRLLWGATLVFIGVAAGLVISSNTGIMSHANAEDTLSISTGTKNLQDIENAFTHVAESALPGVVNIRATIKPRIRGNVPEDFDFFRKFFGPEFPLPQVPEGVSMGSGFIFKKKGNTYYVMTNNHVVRNAKDITITLNDGTKIDDVELVGRDPRTDIAVLKFTYKKKPLTVLKLGDSDKVKIGQWAIAIGSPFGLSSTVTVGVISSVHRRNVALPEGPDYQDFLQTDAAINPGNSGGPLLNIKGEVIGVNTAIASTSGSFAGIGFAVPINLAKNIAEQLIEHGKIERGYLGIVIQPITPELAEALGLKEPKGALVVQVQKGFPAEKAGLKEGDVIVQVDNKKVENVDDLRLYVASQPPGKTVKLKVFRNGKYLTLKVKLTRMPEELSMGKTPTPQEVEGEASVNEWMGMKVEYQDGKVIVVKSEGPARKAGIAPGDELVRIGDIEIKSLKDFEKAAKKYKKIKKPILVVVRQAGPGGVKMKKYLAITPE